MRSAAATSGSKARRRRARGSSIASPATSTNVRRPSPAAPPARPRSQPAAWVIGRSGGATPVRKGAVSPNPGSSHRRIRLHCRAMPRATKPRPLTKTEARRIWLHAQRLDTPEPFGAGPQAVAAAAEHLGYVQIDTINVIERCHHHILYSRIPAYARADLRQAQSLDKSVFEYWTHALSYVPAKHFRYFMPLMKLHKREGHKWFASVKPADMRKVMRLLRRDGALTIRDIEDDVLTEKEHLWQSRKPSKRALQLAFYTGEVTISERTGMLKTYELTSRHFGWNKPPKPASPAEITAYLLDRALRSQGLVSLDSICHLDAPSKAAVRRLIEARVRRKELLPVALEGAGKQEHWARPEVLEPDATATAGEGDAGLVHILS